MTERPGCGAPGAARGSGRSDWGLAAACGARLGGLAGALGGCEMAAGCMGYSGVAEKVCPQRSTTAFVAHANWVFLRHRFLWVPSFQDTKVWMHSFGV